MEGSPLLFRDFQGIVAPLDWVDDPNVVHLTAEGDRSCTVFIPWIHKINGERVRFTEIKRSKGRRARRKSKRVRTTPSEVGPRLSSGDLRPPARVEGGTSMRQQSVRTGQVLGNALYGDGWRARSVANEFSNVNTKAECVKFEMNGLIAAKAFQYMADNDFLEKVLDSHGYAHPAHHRDWTRCLREARRVIVALT